VFFNSNVFLFMFLPVVLVLYHCARAVPLMGTDLRARLLNALLFGVSLFFYAWGEWTFVFLLLASLVGNFFLAQLASAWLERGRSVKPILWLACMGNLGVLFWFKYAAFACSNLAELSLSVGGPAIPVPKPHLPLGVSFFTFQALSYVVDVCRREVPQERSFLRFGVYVFLFPHLIAGPIVRYRDLANQLGERPVGLDRFATGVRRLAVGLAKKLLLADTFAEVADATFQAPAGQLAASAAWLGLVCYSLQIYFDFSGYSDMAIGLAKMFGFDFQENFQYPYIAGTVTDFWRRWHISLSSWFRDYVYIPLGGNRGSALRTYRNLLIVFLLCGLWHGANWTFLLWGLWHGLFLILERRGWASALARLGAIPRHGFTLLAVMLGWVLFRAKNLEQAGEFYSALFGFGTGELQIVEFWTRKLLAAGPVGLLACLPLVPWLIAKRDELATRWGATRAAWLEAVLLPANAIVLAILFLAITMQLAASTFSPFIYFRF
jgi:alginate O-acetyltransferase complex protein AlgI